ncbi:MAG: tRNA (guanosine(46)-N7)-methyltransferase TrmB [Acidobacteriota bacterium]
MTIDIDIDIDVNSVTVPLLWPQIFGVDGPVHVEIGSGKGRFLLKLAAERPDLSLLAVERAGKYHRMVCDKAGRRGLTNVRLLRTTAEDLLFRLLPPASIDALYVLFPDPWPKKRHHKRRLFSPDVTEAMVRCLKPGSPLLVKSDHPAYAEVIEAVLHQTAGLETTDPEEAFSGLPLTGFETKYVRDGRQIHAFSMIKK